jgi:hypothetical protein
VKQASIGTFSLLPDVQTLQLVNLEEMIAGVNEGHGRNSGTQGAIPFFAADDSGDKLLYG